MRHMNNASAHIEFLREKITKAEALHKRHKRSVAYALVMTALGLLLFWPVGVAFLLITLLQAVVAGQKGSEVQSLQMQYTLMFSQAQQAVSPPYGTLQS